VKFEDRSGWLLQVAAERMLPDRRRRSCGGSAQPVELSVTLGLSAVPRSRTGSSGGMRPRLPHGSADAERTAGRLGPTAGLRLLRLARDGMRLRPMLELHRSRRAESGRPGGTPDRRGRRVLVRFGRDAAGGRHRAVCGRRRQHPRIRRAPREVVVVARAHGVTPSRPGGARRDVGEGCESGPRGLLSAAPPQVAQIALVRSRRRAIRRIGCEGGRILSGRAF
jgi:hypothetical protein